MSHEEAMSRTIKALVEMVVDEGIPLEYRLQAAATLALPTMLGSGRAGLGYGVRSTGGSRENNGSKNEEASYSTAPGRAAFAVLMPKGES